MDAIDFVVPWVDGADSQWRAEKRKYESDFSGIDNPNLECRYRDSGFLRYWFRGVEQFAPWVRKIFFITCGQKPAWLDVHHPKLAWVRHEDYIPERFFPTFSSRTIELNLHRIGELSERFVLFNDDVFLMDRISPDFFFREGCPVLFTSLKYPGYLSYSNWSRTIFNNYCLVNQCFDIGQSIWENRKKWFSLSALGMKKVLWNLLCFFANKTLPTGHYGHLAQPHLKSTIAEVWEKCSDVMDATCLHRFRSDDQVNQWLFCAWNQAKGRFFPDKGNRRGRSIQIVAPYMEGIISMITEQSYPQLCLNDVSDNTDAEYNAEQIISAFDRVLPQRSSFELF